MAIGLRKSVTAAAKGQYTHSLLLGGKKAVFTFNTLSLENSMFGYKYDHGPLTVARCFDFWATTLLRDEAVGVVTQIPLRL